LSPLSRKQPTVNVVTQKVAAGLLGVSVWRDRTVSVEPWAMARIAEFVRANSLTAAAPLFPDVTGRARLMSFAPHYERSVYLRLTRCTTHGIASPFVG
jgi:hypothetical protein